VQISRAASPRRLAVPKSYSSFREPPIAPTFGSRKPGPPVALSRSPPLRHDQRRADLFWRLQITAQAKSRNSVVRSSQLSLAPRPA